MDGPVTLHPERMPDPWHFDSPQLLQELARCRELALRIPATTNQIIGPVNSVISALWDLEQRLRYLLRLHSEMQFSFSQRSLDHAQGQPAPHRTRAKTTRRPKPIRSSNNLHRRRVEPLPKVA